MVFCPIALLALHCDSKDVVFDALFGTPISSIYHLYILFMFLTSYLCNGLMVTSSAADVSQISKLNCFLTLAKRPITLGS